MTTNGTSYSIHDNNNVGDNNITKNNDGDDSTNAPISTSDITVAVKTRRSVGDREPVTVMQTFDNICLRCGNLPAIHQQIPGNDSEWKSWTWNEYRTAVNAFAKSLMCLKIDFQKFDRINIIGFNSPEWFISNFGAIAAGGISAGIYTTNKSEACYYIASNSGAKVIVCDGIEQLQKYYAVLSKKKLPNLRAIIVYGLANGESVPPPGIDNTTASSVPVYSFDEFLKLGSDVSDTELQQRSNTWKAGETCTLIYTSGTSGPPKGVMLTNDNITWTTSNIMLSSSKGYLDENDSMISYLPLSHIAAQLLDMHIPLLTGCQIYFAKADALKGSIAKTLQHVRPTGFFAVPRVWEKLHDKLEEGFNSTKGITKNISSWAMSVALAYWEAHEYHERKADKFNATRDIPVLYYLAKPILHLVHKKLGLDRCHDLFVAAAPIDIKIFKYFASLDLPIMELFGQSECTGIHSINTMRAYKFGTVGRPMMGTETKIDPTSGEVLFRGRHVSAGYMDMPYLTAEAIDPDGWLHSGDVVAIDNDCDEVFTTGFLSITGHIKELIITAGGENVPPVLIEEQIKTAMPALSNAIVIGDKRKYLTVLLFLQVELDSDGIASNRLKGRALETSKQIGSVARTTDEVQQCPKWIEYFNNGIKLANSNSPSQAQNVGKWALLSTDLTEKGGELTPTLKLKRSVTAEKYSSIIDALYAQSKR